MAMNSFNLIDLVRTLEDQQRRHAEAADAVAQTLQEQVREHQEASAAIADTLEQISGLLSTLLGGVASAAPRQAVAPAPSKGGGSSGGVSGGGASKAAPRGRSKGAATAADSILEFVRDRGSPTSGDLSEYWRSERRGGNVGKVLSRLVDAGKLSRTPLEAGRGSRYSLA